MLPMLGLGGFLLGVSKSIVLSLVHIFPFYFSVVPLLHPFCPACVYCSWVPLPSPFPSLPSPLWQRHCCIALTLPVPVWHHAIIPLLLPCVTILASTLSPPPPQYPYLLAIAVNIHPLHCTHPILPSLPMLTPMSQ